MSIVEVSGWALGLEREGDGDVGCDRLVPAFAIASHIVVIFPGCQWKLYHTNGGCCVQWVFE